MKFSTMMKVNIAKVATKRKIISGFDTVTANPVRKFWNSVPLLRFTDFFVSLGFGLKFVIDIIEDPVIALWLKTVGGILLFLFGIYTFMSKPKETTKVVKRNKGTLLQNFLTGFAVTVSNPLIIFLFVATFAMFTFIIVENFIAQIIGYIFIVVGALLWWYVLTWLVDKVRNNYNMRIIYIINKSIGIAVMIGAILMILYTVTGHAIDLSEFRFPFNQ